MARASAVASGKVVESDEIIEHWMRVSAVAHGAVDVLRVFMGLLR